MHLVRIQLKMFSNNFYVGFSIHFKAISKTLNNVVLIMKKVCIYVHMQFVYTVSLKKRFAECNENLLMSALRENCSEAWGADIMSTQTLLYRNLFMRKVSPRLFLMPIRFLFVSKNFEDIFSCLNIHPNIKFQFILVFLVTTYIMFLCFFSHAAVLKYTWPLMIMYSVSFLILC